MDAAGDEFLACPSLARDENRRIARDDYGNAREHSLQRERSADDLHNHRRLVNFFTQSSVLLLQPLLNSLAVFYIGRCKIQTRNLSIFVANRIATSQTPAKNCHPLCGPAPPFPLASRL